MRERCWLGQRVRAQESTIFSHKRSLKLVSKSERIECLILPTIYLIKSNFCASSCVPSLATYGVKTWETHSFDRRCVLREGNMCVEKLSYSAWLRFGSRSISEFVSQLCHLNAWPRRTGKTRYEDQARKAEKTNLPWSYYVHKEPDEFSTGWKIWQNTTFTRDRSIFFALFTRQFERLGV